MPSLKDLAKECGVSVATVSKALNDQPDIAAATRERIRAAARRMGYLPNAASKPTVLIIWGSCSLTNGKAA
jgi:LacI family transcriptional regulator